MADVLVVFDFDKTIVAWEFDDWIVHEFGMIDWIEELLPYHALELSPGQDDGRASFERKNNRRNCRCSEKSHDASTIVPAIKTTHALWVGFLRRELQIVSDANLCYIETILKHLGIRECFSEINTHPSFVDEEGRLRILPFHDFQVLFSWMWSMPSKHVQGIGDSKNASLRFSEGKKKSFIYLGDGTADYCPSLKLLEGDFMMPRKNYPVWGLDLQEPLAVDGRDSRGGGRQRAGADPASIDRHIKH